MTDFTFDTTPSIRFGNGTIGEIGQIVRRRAWQQVMLVSDAGVAAAGLLERPLHLLNDAKIGVTLFDAVVADPPEEVLRQAVSRGALAGVEAVIGIGGGSSLDVAKLCALLLGSGEDLVAAYGVGNAKGPRLPLMLVPTTAGTGAEVTPVAIITTGKHVKQGVVSKLLLPDLALLDPELTICLPPNVTAATGIDAVVHAIEAFTSTSPNNNPLSRALARQALQLLAGSLLAAVARGGDLEARSSMLLGAMLAGQAFANAPVAAVHALAYPIGGRFGIAHGLSNALVLPHVMRFNMPACAPAYAELAALAFPALIDAPIDRRAERFVDALVDLASGCGLPSRLRDVGIPKDAMPMLAAGAMQQQRLLQNNPRQVALADAEAIYRSAW